MKGAGYASELMRYVFLARVPSWDADGSLEIALHTADPGRAGTAATAEARYPGYGRVSVSRAADGWAESTEGISNAGLVRWPTCEGDATTPKTRVTHWSIVRPGGGAALVMYRGELDVPIDVGPNIRPEIEAGGITIRED